MTTRDKQLEARMADPWRRKECGSFLRRHDRLKKSDSPHLFPMRMAATPKIIRRLLRQFTVDATPRSMGAVKSCWPCTICLDLPRYGRQIAAIEAVRNSRQMVSKKIVALCVAASICIRVPAKIGLRPATCPTELLSRDTVSTEMERSMPSMSTRVDPQSLYRDTVQTVIQQGSGYARRRQVARMAFHAAPDRSA